MSEADKQGTPERTIRDIMSAPVVSATAAETIASTNKNSVIDSSEQALATNLAAISALFSDPSTAQASQGSSDPSQALALVSS